MSSAVDLRDTQWSTRRGGGQIEMAVEHVSEVGFTDVYVCSQLFMWRISLKFIDKSKFCLANDFIWFEILFDFGFQQVWSEMHQR